MRRCGLSFDEGRLNYAGNAVTASSNANEYVVEFDTAGSKDTVTAPSVDRMVFLGLLPLITVLFHPIVPASSLD